ncbi:hypothetical protein KAK06_13395 [Ideonella sp. 4Y11]|uniref:DNA-binding protein n=1 Tax=Ideonella aquatica TaxID=2824119 RepID=A0A940YJR1_9BURK|nr:hypothetical protein [Ideonella aquatica]MBQ0959942.1 hypothetical protein [Ideonella aquatica]
MGIKELAAKVAAAHPEIAAPQINKVLRTALTALAEELGSAADGPLKLSPLGNFQVMTKPVKGEEGGESKRRIILKLAKAKDAESKAERSGKKAPGAERSAARAEKKAARQAGKAATKAATKAAAKAAKPA